jgi:hypothetical protein
LESSDERALDVRVAGASALVVAKVHKISERHGTDRQTDKDALDVLRLLRGTETHDLADRWQKLLTDKPLGGGSEIGVGVARGAVRQAAGSASRWPFAPLECSPNPGEIAASCEALAADLLAAIK